MQEGVASRSIERIAAPLVGSPPRSHDRRQKILHETAELYGVSEPSLYRALAQHMRPKASFSINVSGSRCNRSVLNDCGHILNQCEQGRRFVNNQFEQKTALLSITAVYVIDPLQLETTAGATEQNTG